MEGEQKKYDYGPAESFDPDYFTSTLVPLK